VADLLAALCLVLVLEGLFLFVFPTAWKQVAAKLQTLPERSLRLMGGLMAAAGLVALALVRG
jgi:uncharacterized protein